MCECGALIPISVLNITDHKFSLPPPTNYTDISPTHSSITSSANINIINKLINNALIKLYSALSPTELLTIHYTITYHLIMYKNIT